jgi:hypothetical protein
MVYEVIFFSFANQSFIKVNLPFQIRKSHVKGMTNKNYN